MLRVSAMKNETEVDLQAVVGSEDSAAKHIPLGAELMKFAECVAAHDAEQLADIRATLVQKAGAAVLVDAAGVAANFQRMVRIADAIGIPVDDMESSLGKSVREAIDIKGFASAANTLVP